ncbi:MAG TPA: homoserine kinase [Vicinamibacterales bacterium]|nr:homoserine kinase [Vicinamibacterales bacterium]
MIPSHSALAFAPASVGNVAVGFDILGHSVNVAGDRVHATRIAERRVTIAGITGVVSDLPTDPERNAAGAAVLALVERLGLDGGFELTIEKGIPLKSGLGGSAASAVAGVVAAAALLAEPVGPLQLLKCAMRGEEAACGSAHVDNIAASLYGGLVLTVGADEPVVIQIPVPELVRCVLVRPHMELSTRESRGILRETVKLSDFVWQQANLAGFLAGCYTGDLGLIRASLQDVVIEPQRRRLIPGFEAVKAAAMANGSFGCSISGGGPTIFAWCEAPAASAVCSAMVDAFRGYELATDAWITSIDASGARLL